MCSARSIAHGNVSAGAGPGSLPEAVWNSAASRCRHALMARRDRGLSKDATYTRNGLRPASATAGCRGTATVIAPSSTGDHLNDSPTCGTRCRIGRERNIST
ncbi:hypothetical protein Arub01_46770 [Actinomadura rubrobrunea]|uniref:Uncharacterized protein n=1 Tax=Actinomadura rubrobrunea TaxID=115335 RepID=A0A9W6Q0P6_9ACTN|nr:hypothetical protein Arub01_46770 [Actinomadura rubrobrunea]